MLARFLAAVLCAITGTLVFLPHGGMRADDAPVVRRWTFDAAAAQLRLYPRDSYLQYVVMQLGRREGRQDQVIQGIGEMAFDESGPGDGGRRAGVDLFGIFTGALAVQESLQMDAMRNPAQMGASRPARMRVNSKMREEEPNPGPVAVSDLPGPGVQSHPWQKMLAGRKPEISPLARLVPDDFYLVEFRSLGKMLEAMDITDLWGTHLFNQAAQDARSQKVGERLKRQLVVETSDLLRPFYDLAVGDVAVTGSDLFLREGSDATLLFQIRQPELFKARMDGFLKNAESQPGVKRETGEYLGVPYTHLVAADRAIHVFSAYPAPDLHVRGNSLPGFRRVLEAIKGQAPDGKAVRRLGDTDEYAFIRTIMPRGAAEEDGFIYLSDPFIRRLVGAQVKLTERRRMLCYNHLRMIGHATLLYRTEHGKAPDSLAELARAECTPGRFNQAPLVCPDGGEYRFSDDGMTAVCSHHGSALSMIPCCEIPLAKVSADEADAYKAFVENYNQYWRTFFDPIALRLHVAPDRYRLETIVLPLIDNSIYTGMARVLGGKPEALDAVSPLQRNIFSVAVRVNREAALAEAGLADPDAAEEVKKPAESDPTAADPRCMNNLKQIGLALHNYESANARFPPTAIRDKQGKALLSWRVAILPFIEEGTLYKEFHLEEPWDSEHNKKLISRMPAVYRCPLRKPGNADMTTYLAPVGKDTVFPADGRRIRFSDIMDGTSNTIMIVDADEDRAVVWTRPDDWPFDPDKPRAGLTTHPAGAFPVLFCDGSIHFLRDTIDKETLRALFTRAGGEVVSLQGKEALEQMTRAQFQPPRESLIPGLPAELVERLNYREFLNKGIGNQVGFHVFDAMPTFDFNLPGFLGQVMGTFGGRGFGRGDEEMTIAFLIASLNAPVCASVSVRDAAVVDRFLDRLDSVLTEVTRGRRFGFLPARLDFSKYRTTTGSKREVRCLAIGIENVIKFRLFWARAGNGLYVASKPFIIEDLLGGDAAGQQPARDGGPLAHGLVRLRPRNWDQVLSDYRFAWAENNRTACMNNLGPLTDAARALAADGGRPTDERRQEVLSMAERTHTVHFLCPEGGRYELTPDGKGAACSVHGTAAAPRQPPAPLDTSRLGRLLKNFGGMTLALTFLEDGLHAVVEIERK
jgi:hypothetical protein